MTPCILLARCYAIISELIDLYFDIQRKKNFCIGIIVTIIFYLGQLFFQKCLEFA